MEHQRVANHPQQQTIPSANLKCPRCGSMSTKFRYYNNYSKEQPRHYCNACKRYWTVGGKLRNIPVGDTSCKVKRAKVSSSNTISQTPQTPLQPPRVQIQTQTQGNNGFVDTSNNITTNVEMETTDVDAYQWLSFLNDYLNK